MDTDSVPTLKQRWLARNYSTRQLAQIAEFTKGTIVALKVGGSKGVVPDMEVAGNLYIASYEPSQIYLVSPERRVELLIDDPDAHTLCHPTNIAFRGTELFAANLGHWHVTKIDVGVQGLSLPLT